MADLNARYGPNPPPLAGTTLVSAGAIGTYVVLRDIHIVNTTDTAATFTLGINGLTAATALFFNVTLQPKDFITRTGNLPLNGGATPDTLQASQGTAGAITITIGGVSGP